MGVTVETSTLTARQREVHRYMLDHQREHGVPPTVREIGEHFAIGSPNGVICHLKALVAKGYAVRYAANASRCLVAVDRDAPRCDCCGQPLPPDAEQASEKEVADA